MGVCSCMCVRVQRGMPHVNIMLMAVGALVAFSVVRYMALLSGSTAPHLVFLPVQSSSRGASGGLPASRAVAVSATVSVLDQAMQTLIGGAGSANVLLALGLMVQATGTEQWGKERKA